MAVVYASAQVGSKVGEHYSVAQAGGGSSHPAAAHISVAIDTTKITNVNQLRDALMALIPQIKASSNLADG